MKRTLIVLSILVIGTIFFIGIFGLFLLHFSTPPNENLIGIENTGNQPIYNLTITIRDYEEKIMEIPFGERRSVALPDMGFAERSIRLTYFVNGESKNWAGEYAEENYCAYITIGKNSVSVRHLNFRQCAEF